MVTPEIPKRIHPEGFSAAWNAGALVGKVDDIFFGTGTAYSDGSVKWPRWRATATGEFAIAQRREGKLDMAYAESAHIKFRQVAGNMEIGALLARVERLPVAGTQHFGIDCQMVVSGFGKRLS